MIFFTADTHFGHANSDRPFGTIEEMNETMIGKWNDRVGGMDTVYIVCLMLFIDTNDADISLQIAQNMVYFW